MSDGVLAVIQAVVFVYDFVTFPLYTVTQRPWTVVSSYSKERSQVVDQDETSITIKAHHKMTKPLQVCLQSILIRHSREENSFFQELIDAGVDTMAKCFKFGLAKQPT